MNTTNTKKAKKAAKLGRVSLAAAALGLSMAAAPVHAWIGHAYTKYCGQWHGGTQTCARFTWAPSGHPIYQLTVGNRNSYRWCGHFELGYWRGSGWVHDRNSNGFCVGANQSVEVDVDGYHDANLNLNADIVTSWKDSGSNHTFMSNYWE